MSQYEEDSAEFEAQYLEEETAKLASEFGVSEDEVAARICLALKSRQPGGAK